MNFIKTKMPRDTENLKFILDMEMAVKSVLTDLFPSASITFCFYHFCNAHFRRIQSRFAVDYGTDIEFSRTVRMFSALAFLPITMVERGFDIMYDHTVNDQRFEDFAYYFECQYIGKVLPNSERGPARVPKKFWNQHTNVVNLISRTNNRVEGWNRRVADLADCSHRHIFKFVEIIRKEMVNTHLKLVQIKSGQTVTPRRITYKDMD